jgi:choline dehydrogenase-like flavoprotein
MFEQSAGELILSGGSCGTPAILLRSGVGPAADLAQPGIHVVADLPVGRHLQDQPFYYNAYALKPDALDMRPAVGALVSVWGSAGKDAGQRGPNRPTTRRANRRPLSVRRRLVGDPARSG